MKQIFDKAPLNHYIKGLELNDNFDSLILWVVLGLSILIFSNAISSISYQYSLCFLATIKTFLLLNTKDRLKQYKEKFDAFYNEK